MFIFDLGSMLNAKTLVDGRAGLPEGQDTLYALYVNLQPLIWSLSLLCSNNSFHFSGKLSTRFWSVSVEIFAQSSRRAFVRSDTDVV